MIFHTGGWIILPLDLVYLYFFFVASSFLQIIKCLQCFEMVYSPSLHCHNFFFPFICHLKNDQSNNLLILSLVFRLIHFKMWIVVFLIWKAILFCLFVLFCLVFVFPFSPNCLSIFLILFSFHVNFYPDKWWLRDLSLVAFFYPSLYMNWDKRIQILG